MLYRSIVLALSLLAATSHAAEMVGHIIDKQCVNLCTDVPEGTPCTPDLVNVFYNPEEHTGWCLLLSVCVESGYVLMSANSTAEDGKREILLDLAGDVSQANVLEYIQKGSQSFFPLVTVEYDESLVTSDMDGVPMAFNASFKDPWTDGDFFTGAETFQVICATSESPDVFSNNLCMRSDVVVTESAGMYTIEANGCPDHPNMMGSSGTIVNTQTDPTTNGGSSGGGTCGAGCGACGGACAACGGGCGACAACGGGCGACAACGGGCGACGGGCGACGACGGGCGTCGGGCAACGGGYCDAVVFQTGCDAGCAGCGAGCGACDAGCAGCGAGCAACDAGCAGCGAGCAACDAGCAGCAGCGAGCGACGGACAGCAGCGAGCGACGGACAGCGSGKTPSMDMIGTYTPTYQHYRMEIPANPGTPGEPVYFTNRDDVVGILANGILLDSHQATWAYDSCNGHSDKSRHQYHYHIPPSCFLDSMGLPAPESALWWINDEGTEVRAYEDMAAQFPPTSATGSPVIGFARDGFPIFGPYDDNGVLQRGALFGGDVDECNGKMDSMGNYGYYLTVDPPFAPPCLRGEKGLFTYHPTEEVCPMEGIKNLVLDPSSVVSLCEKTSFGEVGDCAEAGVFDNLDASGVGSLSMIFSVLVLALAMILV